MPDVREKLVELLKKFVPTIWAEDCDENRHPMCDDIHCSECIAERLIANGVTIQRWIPVTERLPEDDIPSARYLCYANGYVRILKYWRMYKSFEYGGKPIKVTHWMPLPEATKGE